MGARGASKQGKERIRGRPWSFNSLSASISSLACIRAPIAIAGLRNLLRFPCLHAGSHCPTLQSLLSTLLACGLTYVILMEYHPSILAFHIVWTTYGTWLPGDLRGWIKSGVPGIRPPDPEIEQSAREKMAEPPVILTKEQRELTEQAIVEHCRIRGWILHAVNARSNHVHVVVTANCEPDVVRNQLKAWCSRKLQKMRA